MAAYKLVLIRHGESAWNLENRFSGWYDADLSPAGHEEAKRGGQALRGTGGPAAVRRARRAASRPPGFHPRFREGGPGRRLPSGLVHWCGGGRGVRSRLAQGHPVAWEAGKRTGRSQPVELLRTPPGEILPF